MRVDIRSRFVPLPGGGGGDPRPRVRMGTAPVRIHLQTERGRRSACRPSLMTFGVLALVVQRAAQACSPCHQPWKTCPAHQNGLQSVPSQDLRHQCFLSDKAAYNQCHLEAIRKSFSDTCWNVAFFKAPPRRVNSGGVLRCTRQGIRRVTFVDQVLCTLWARSKWMLGVALEAHFQCGTSPSEGVQLRDTLCQAELRFEARFCLDQIVLLHEILDNCLNLLLLQPTLENMQYS